MPKRFTIREVADRGGVSTSALRFYEDRGLLTSERDARGYRQYPPEVLRRVAFITVGRSIGLSLAEISAALARLPGDRTPTKRGWERVSQRWRSRMGAQILEMQIMRARLSSCIGCGCLSLRDCALSNKRDRASAFGSGPRYLLGDVPPAS